MGQVQLVSGASVVFQLVSGASVAPAAAVHHFNPRTDLAPVITVVAASTASNMSSVAFATSAGANDNGSMWGDFEKKFLTCFLRRS